ncbi:MAG: hypothetical protein B7C24_16995 [Bacteroidetes bacterium 4572_77]|nr:MAG: hypothetical protein B7C24_16995 [Bacteroidetes bacterium 4572_77]
MGYALAVCNNGDDAKDLIQETILATFLGFEKLKKKTAFKAYIFQTARRIYYKSKRNKLSCVNLDDTDIINYCIKNAAPQNLAVQELYTAMQELTFEQREAISMFEITGFSIKEIAKIQNANVNTVKSRLKRGKERLTELLQDNSTEKTINNSRVMEVQNEL